MATHRRFRFVPRALLLLLLLPSVATLAQNDPPAPATPAIPARPPTATGPARTPAPIERPAPTDTSPRTISPRPGTPIAKGTVSRLLPSPDGSIDGLLLADGTQIRFPPHMSQDLASTVKPGSPVAVEGYREAGGAVRARVITEQKSGRSVVEHDPAPAKEAQDPPNVRPEPLSAEGRIQQLMRDPAGDVNGVVLEDGSVVRFPPNVRRQFPGVLQPGNVVSASGIGTQTPFGRALEASKLGSAAQSLPDAGTKRAPGAAR